MLLVKSVIRLVPHVSGVSLQYTLPRVTLSLDLNPNAVIFSSSQRGQIIVSNIGLAIWLGAIIYSIKTFGFFEVFRLYLVPYLWYAFW